MDFFINTQMDFHYTWHTFRTCFTIYVSCFMCAGALPGKQGITVKKIQYSFKVSRLLSVVAVKRKKDSEQIVFSVFGIPIKRMGNEKPVKKNVVKSEKEKEPEPLQDNKEETGEPVLATEKKKRNKERTRRRELFPGQKSEEKEKQKKLFISRAIQYNEVCETKQETFETVVSGNKKSRLSISHRKR